MMRSSVARRVPLRSLRRRILARLSFSSDATSPSAASSPSSSSQAPPRQPAAVTCQEGEDLRTRMVSSEFPALGPSPAAEKAAGGAEQVRQKGKAGTRGDYKEEESRILRAALGHVEKLGWSDSALVAGAREVGLSPSIIGSFPRKEAALVEFFMDDRLEKLVEKIESGELNMTDLALGDRLSKLLRLGLEMQAPYISKWAQALSIQAQPQNVAASFKQRAMLIDEIWHAAGDRTVDIDWYVKRAVLGGIYSASEIFMLTDNSAGFSDTWLFLDHRIKDAFDVQKAVQEAAYLAEAVGAGVENSVQDLVKRVSQGFKM